jgi:hypothetical protein
MTQRAFPGIRHVVLLFSFDPWSRTEAPSPRPDCHDAAARGIARSGDLIVVRKSRQLHARVDAELREHVAEVAVHGVGRDEKALSDLSIRQPFGDETRDGEFRRRQRSSRPVRDDRRGRAYYLGSEFDVWSPGSSMRSGWMRKASCATPSATRGAGRA